MKLTKNINIIGDVQDVLLKHVKSIYENSYLYSMYNPTFEGYPQLTAYVQATLHKIMVNNASFEFLKSSANIVLFLVVLLFAELNLSKISKFIIILIYISLVFNSEWLKLIFIDSLMTEGIISYLFATLIFSISNQTKSTNIGNSISFLLLGILFIGKQFISTLSLIAAVSFLFSKSKRKFVWIGFIGVLIKEVSYTTYFKNLFKNYHLKEVDIFDAFIDLILFRNLKIENLFIIAKNLYLDKPFFIIFIYFIGTIIFYLFNYSSKKYELNLISLLSILNIGLVIALYIGIWKNMELESPIRFLLYKLPLYLYFQIKVLEDYILKNKIH